MKRPRPGGWCCYCKRLLTPAMPECSTSMTFDHVVARSLGGKGTVPCCRKCNNLKGSIEMNDWWWFVRNTPRYWKLYDTTQQVDRAIRQFRFAMARKDHSDGEGATA
jgi:5-methylcytosine-specific restriction endonuclease McrA